MSGGAAHSREPCAMLRVQAVGRTRGARARSSPSRLHRQFTYGAEVVSIAPTVPWRADGRPGVRDIGPEMAEGAKFSPTQGPCTRCGGEAFIPLTFGGSPWTLSDRAHRTEI